MPIANLHCSFANQFCQNNAKKGVKEGEKNSLLLVFLERRGNFGTIFASIIMTMTAPTWTTTTTKKKKKKKKEQKKKKNRLWLTRTSNMCLSLFH